MLSLIQALQQQLAMSRQIQLIVVKRLSSQHSAMDDASDTQLKTKSQLKSELGSEEALKKNRQKMMFLPMSYRLKAKILVSPC